MATPGSVTTKQIVDQAVAVTSVWESQAQSFINTLAGNVFAASNLNITVPGIPNLLPGTAYEGTLFGRLVNEPILSGSVTFSPAATEPGASAVGAPPVPLLVTTPDYNIAAPALDLPARPQLVTPTAPSAPMIEEITLPVPPTLDLPTVPSLSNVVFPDAPNLQLPVFSEVAPQVLPGLSLTETFEYQDEVFDDSLLVAMRGKLRTDVDEGGYGIEVDDENALWARARDREFIELDATQDAIAETYANRGYDLPPGALLGALAETRNQAEQRLNEANREISIKRADLFRDNRQFALQQGMVLEQARLTDYGFKMERALNAKRFTAEFSIQVHDLKVRDFNARLQRYTVLADVYQTRLQAALTQIQIYEAEVRAAVAKQQADQTSVDLYRALLEAANSRVNLFEAQTRAAGLAIEIQRAKVESFRAEVQAFASQIDGNRSQLDVYTAGINGERAKIDIFTSEVEAYSSRVQASAVEQRSINEQAQVVIQGKQLQLQEYQAAIDRHRLSIASETARIESLLRKHATDATVFASAVSGYEALARVDLAESDAQVKAIEEQTKRLQVNAQIGLQAATNILAERFQSASAGAQITTGVIQAANSTLQGLIVEELSQSTTV